ncbi:flavin reductase family protein, partial [Burkholderia cenocepacia]|uniref:flavin reductase family protein n=1 Tax=Burkholderia cenocepacia TaxID=95486 RepID=UPI00286D78CE
QLSQSFANGKISTHFSDEAGFPRIDEMVRNGPSGTHLYCCGPTGMIDAFLAATADYDPQLVHIERFGGATAAAEGGFDVVLAESERTLHVRAGQTILERLLEEGIHVPNSCREGVCGSCEVQLLAGRADHRDLIFTAEERAANTGIFVCCSGSLDPSLTLKL